MAKTPEPLVLIPGLNCTPALYAPQWPALASGRQILVAETAADDTIAAMVERLLSAAPERFALCGLSMGGYIAFEVMRRAPGSDTLPLSMSFALFGQRYTVDSHVFSNLVYDRLPTRVVPNPLDVAFAAQRSTRKAQRGPNAQPPGNRVRSGGCPSIGARRARRGSSSRGTERRRPSV